MRAGCLRRGRLVARVRARGHGLPEIREAIESGRLVFGYVEELMPSTTFEYTIEEAAQATGLEPELVRRIHNTIGFTTDSLQRITDDDLAVLRHVSAVLASGFPLVALLQLLRVYGQALSQIADAEVRLFPPLRARAADPRRRPGLQMAEEMSGLTRDLLPLARRS